MVRKLITKQYFLYGNGNIVTRGGQMAVWPRPKNL